MKNNDNHRQNVTNLIINQSNAFIYANFCNKTFFSSYVPPQSRRILHTLTQMEMVILEIESNDH